jgi:glycosyltransferase involved in cell wall biosynthesis
MKISIVTVCYNSEKTLSQTFQSVAIQNYQDLEYIIVDGLSQDSTPSIIQEWLPKLPGQIIVICEKDKGIYDAMNKGLARATGDVVGFLNSDDVFADENTLAKIANGFEESSADMVYGDLVYTKETDLSKVTRTWRLGPLPSLGMKTGWHPAHPTMYIRRQIIQQEPFDLDFRIAADYEMMVRLIERQKISSHYIASTLVKMREGGASNQSFKNIFKANRECLRAWSKNGLFANPLTIGMKLGRKILQY